MEWFAELLENATEEELIDKFQRLTTEKQCVTLMTIHKSKGLEFNRVVFLDYPIEAKNKHLE